MKMAYRYVVIDVVVILIIKIYFKQFLMFSFFLKNSMFLWGARFWEVLIYIFSINW